MHVFSIRLTKQDNRTHAIITELGVPYLWPNEYEGVLHFRGETGCRNRKQQRANTDKLTQPAEDSLEKYSSLEQKNFTPQP
jgi:hypothetical protein